MKSFSEAIMTLTLFFNKTTSKNKVKISPTLLFALVRSLSPLDGAPSGRFPADKELEVRQKI